MHAPEINQNTQTPAWLEIVQSSSSLIGEFSIILYYAYHLKHSLTIEMFPNVW